MENAAKTVSFENYLLISCLNMMCKCYSSPSQYNYIAGDEQSETEVGAEMRGMTANKCIFMF